MFQTVIRLFNRAHRSTRVISRHVCCNELPMNTDGGECLTRRSLVYFYKATENAMQTTRAQVGHYCPSARSSATFPYEKLVHFLPSSSSSSSPAPRPTVPLVFSVGIVFSRPTIAKAHLSKCQRHSYHRQLTLRKACYHHLREKVIFFLKTMFIESFSCHIKYVTLSYKTTMSYSMQTTCLFQRVLFMSLMTWSEHCSQ